MIHKREGRWPCSDRERTAAQTQAMPLAAGRPVVTFGMPALCPPRTDKNDVCHPDYRHSANEKSRTFVHFN
ncbi:hypothetical protein ACC771_01150, partial [Rhizobium ruizarguesonis]